MPQNTKDQQSLDSVQQYDSFSGSDIVASISIPGHALDTIPSDGEDPHLGAFYTIGNLQTISISTHRDLAPVRALGYDSPITYKKGTRTVSGTIVFVKVYNEKIQEFFRNYVESAVLDVRGFRAFDRTLPFNIQLNQANEYGTTSGSAYLTGVHLMDGGTVLSINDIYTEQTYTYVAREYLDFGMNTDNLNNDITPHYTINGTYRKITSE